MDIVVLLPRRRAARAELTRVSDSASRADVATRKNEIVSKGNCFFFLPVSIEE